MKSFRVAGFLAFTSIRKGNAGVVLLAIAVLILVSLNLLFVSGLLEGLVWSADDKVINVYAGDIIVESSTDAALISNVDSLINKIETLDGVVVAIPRNSLGAEISYEDRRTNCVVWGIRPDKEKLAFRISQSMIEGTYLDPDDRDEILLGLQLAGADRTDIELYSRSLKNVHAGDKIKVNYANGIEKRYTVKGIFYSEFLQADLQALVSEKEFKSVLPVGDSAASIRLKVAARADVPAIIDEISHIRDGLRILTWVDYAGIIRSMTNSFIVINAILNVVNLLVAGITVFIVTYVDVTNRRRQIGIQRAIGISQSSITMAYLMRAVFYAVVGTILGSLAFLYLVVPLEARYPFHFPFGDVYLQTGLQSLTRTGLILLVASLVAAFVPVAMALRIKILDAIWG